MASCLSRKSPDGGQVRVVATGVEYGGQPLADGLSGARSPRAGPVAAASDAENALCATGRSAELERYSGRDFLHLAALAQIPAHD